MSTFNNLEILVFAKLCGIINSIKSFKYKNKMVAIQFYKKFLTEFVRQQMILLGPNLAVDTVNRVEGIEVNNRGQVVEIIGEYNLILQSVVEEFSKLSPQLTNYFIHMQFSRYPEIAAEYPASLSKVNLVCSLIKTDL